MTDDSLRSGPQRTAIDTTVSHSARIWNYWLGGKDNYQVDQEVGEQILSFVPSLSALRVPTGTFSPAPWIIWPARKGSGSSWTSVRVCRP